MPALIIACLSQKGGVGKSTMARLIAHTYANAGWQVKIADFNTKQLTSVDWVAQRMASGVTPEIAAAPMSSTRALRREPYDLIVIDGKPDSDDSSLEIARIADLIIIPTGLSIDDLRPQLLFINELVQAKVERRRIAVILNKVGDSSLAIKEARGFLAGAGYSPLETTLGFRTGYQMAQNMGHSVAETVFDTLNARAAELATEIVNRANALGETS